MKIKLEKSKTSIIIPDGYKKQKVDKDAKNITIYAKTTASSQDMIALFEAENPMEFDLGVSALKEKMASDVRTYLSENNGVIEVDAGVTYNGLDYAYGLLKNKKEVGTGVWYNLLLNFKTDEDIIYEIQAAFEEIGTTGVRDAVVYELIKRYETEIAEAGLSAEWMQDPYEADYKEGFLMNISEKPGFDVLFPEHPLTQARELIDSIVYGVVRKAEKSEKSSKEKRENNSEDVSDDKAWILKLLSYSIEDKKKEHTERLNQTEPEKLKKEGLNEQIAVAIDIYNRQYDTMKDSGFLLYHQKDKAVDLIEFIENLINSISNHPKSFDKEFSEINEIKQTFRSADDFVEKELESAKKQAVGAGAGVAAGAGIAAMAPSAALWVATTFGTASTGTAISTLSGAAATNAALAWLGGGALAVGGHGIAGGTALLALAGPVGWGIAGASVLTSVVLFTRGKMKSNKEKEAELISIKNNIEILSKVTAQIDNLAEKTTLLRENLSQTYADNLPLYGCDYSVLSDKEKLQLGSLVNNTKTMAVLVKETVESEKAESVK